MSNAIDDSTDEMFRNRTLSIGYLSRINFRMFDRVLEKHTSKHEMTTGQWRFLRVLWEQDDITQKQLSDRAGTREATTVRTVNSLVKSGFVKRKPCPIDKRKSYIVLTSKAKKLRDVLIPKVIEANQEALKGINKRDYEKLRKLLSKTYSNMEDYLSRLESES